MQNTETREIRTAREQLDRFFAFINRALRHWLKAGIIIALGGILSVGFALMSKRRYTSEAVLLYREPIDQSYVAGGDVRRISAHDLGRRLRELLLGRPRLKQVIDQFKLLQATVNDRSYIEAEDKLRMLIDFRFGGGDTFHIAYIGDTPDQAQKVTARLAEILVEEELRLRSSQARDTVRFLENERKRAENDLKNKEKELAVFLSKNPEFAADESPTSSGAALRAASRKKKTGSSASPLDILKRQAARIKDKLAQAKGLKPTVIRDPKLQSAKTQAEADVSQAEQRVRDLRTRVTNQHPDMLAAVARVKQAKTRLRRISNREQSAAKIVKLGQDQVKALENNLNKVRAQISAYKRRHSSKTTKAGDKKSKTKGEGVANVIVALETQWTRLNRQVGEARERYTRMEARAFRATLSLDVKKQSYLRVIDPAYLPKRPSGGGRTKMVLLGAATSFFFAFGLVFALALIDERIYNRRDAERLRLVEVLVVIPAKPTFWQKIYRPILSVFSPNRRRRKRG